FAALEAEGRTGHPLAWENARAAILADLHALLEKDEGWRRAEGLVPTVFERSFGDPSAAEPWPAARVVLDDGRAVAFRGLIDRIDLSPSGEGPRRALVIDYKTGSANSYLGLGADPLLAGRHVQLALYARALRAALACPDPLEVRAEFRFVTSRAGFKRVQIAATEAVDARLNQVIQTVADGVGAGCFLPVPGQRDRVGFENCRYCDFDRVCSATRDEAWERKQGDPAAHWHLELAVLPNTAGPGDP